MNVIMEIAFNLDGNGLAMTGQGGSLTDVADRAAARLSRAASAESDVRAARGVCWGAAAVAILMSTNASAQTVSAFEDGNSLYERCAEPTATFSRGVCLGYVVGIFDAMLSAGGTPIAGFSVCLPRGVTKGQAFDVVTRFLASHPELRHLTAASLVARALEQAFPCRR